MCNQCDRRTFLLSLGAISAFPGIALAAGKKGSDKVSPDEALAMLKKGNERFVQGKHNHPHLDKERRELAHQADQGDHAFATILSCSDSRVPVELIFDAGIMNLFVIRVAGNVCNVDEAGSTEYGLAHVHTPVLVVLGHTKCGAVAAVTQVAQGATLELERNIPPLLAPIKPAVERAMKLHPDRKGAEVVPYAIEENVWQSITDLFMKSPSTRNLVKSGKVKVVGAIYDIGSGKVNWLPETKVSTILKNVEASPKRAMNPMA
jgi:carbonic anhydrase